MSTLTASVPVGALRLHVVAGDTGELSLTRTVWAALPGHDEAQKLLAFSRIDSQLYAQVGAGRGLSGLRYTAEVGK